MTIKKAIKILRNEVDCVKRASTCDRNCGKCDLVLEEDEILAAYGLAIAALKEFEYWDCNIPRSKKENDCND